MTQSTKIMSERDQAQTLRRSYNDANDTLGVDGFVVGAVGRKVVKVNTSSTVETYSFYQNQTDLMYTIVITYTDNTKADFVSAERTV